MERKSIGDVSLDVPEDIQEYQRKQELIGDGERVFARLSNPSGDIEVWCQSVIQSEPSYVRDAEAELALIAYVESLKAPNRTSPSQEEIDSLRQLYETKKSADDRFVKMLEDKIASMSAEYSRQAEINMQLRREAEALKNALKFYISN